MSVGFTCIAASVAHVGGDQAPLVRGWVVVLYRGQVTRAIVSSNHIQQAIDGAHTCTQSAVISNTVKQEIYIHGYR